MSKFSAGPQALGYFFQSRRALLALLRADEDAAIVIEGLDDIELRTGRRPSRLEQAKHHVSKQADLTDSSADLWKTIRIWSSKSERLTPDTLRQLVLALVTTSQAPAGSVAQLLRDDANRDIASAYRRLNDVAQTSDNAALAPAFNAFLGLPPDIRARMVGQIYVVDGAPDVLETEGEILRLIRYATHPEFAEKLYERLEGWWLARVVRQLLDRSGNPISLLSVHEKIAGIAEEYRADNLPIDFLDALPAVIDPDGDERGFVRQLRAITANKPRIERAIVDYYRAYEQRSRWLREDLLIDDDLSDYEARLIDEWDRVRLSVQDLTELDESDDNSCRRFGLTLLDWMETKADVQIRPRVTEGYVMRGSYHMLADEDRPRVWWHPLFLARLKILANRS